MFYLVDFSLQTRCELSHVMVTGPQPLIVITYTVALEMLKNGVHQAVQACACAMAKWISIFSFILTAHVLNVLAYTVPPGSPGFYHGNSSAAVTFDSHSLFLDNKRLYVFSGEVHPWRLPSGKAAWRDVFQKMKVSILFFRDC